MSQERRSAVFALEAGNPALAELRQALAVLEAVAADRSLLAQMGEEERRRFLIAAGRAVHPEVAQKRRLVKAFRRTKRRSLEEHDRGLVGDTGIRQARGPKTFMPPPRSTPAEHGTQRNPGGSVADLKAAPELLKPRSCYVCKAEYRRLHAFYDALCPACAALNYEKRFQSADLDGRVALVTGARVKIGYQAALKLLRAGATVVATTRFPHDAARRYASEPDFGRWSSRLVVRGLDLRHSPSVEIFCSHISGELGRLDLLVNNACQTVRRPPGFYAHLLELEERPLDALPEPLRPLLRAHHECVRLLDAASLPRPDTLAQADGALVAWRGGGAGPGLRHSARLSQARLGFDEARREDLFPEGALDADSQQLDLRSVNSWRLTLGEVATPEMIEVQLVNAVAPFILCGRLKPLMLRTPGREKHIVNVSAMEGVFSRGTKTDRHPHTNMAKAALNMLTLTSARDYVRDGIHMNAVDTGWITDEDPFVHAARKRDQLGFEPPLDIVDGAARVLDPFLSGLNTGAHAHGKFFKDYKPSSW